MVICGGYLVVVTPPSLPIDDSNFAERERPAALDLCSPALRDERPPLSLPLRAPAAARPTPPAAASQSQSYSFCPPSRTMRTVPATVKPRHWLYVYVRLYVVVLRLTRCCRSRAPRDTTGTCVDSGQYANINQRINSSYHFRRSTISSD